MLLTILVIIILVTVSVSYGVSVHLGHVPIAFPYISETGTAHPESCIFGLGMNLASFLYAVAVWLRYHELKEYRSMVPNCRISPRLSLFTMWLGLASAFGLCVVANFQVTKVPVPHYLGALFCFFGGTIYFGLQAWFSKRMCPAVSTKPMVLLRAGLCLLSALSLVVCFGAAAIAVPQFDGKDPVQWGPQHKGYALHLVSTAAEWMVALVFVGSIVTYIPEMRLIAVRPPSFRIAVSHITVS